MKILFLSRWFPYPPSNGSKIRIYNLLRGLSEHHEVSLLSFNDQPKTEPNINALRSICKKIEVVPWKFYNPNSPLALWSLLGLTPRSMVDSFSTDMKKRLDFTLLNSEFDISIASEIDMAIYSRLYGSLPAVLDELQIGVLYDRISKATSIWQNFRYRLTWIKLQNFLAIILKNFEACTVSSTREQQLISQAVPGYKPTKVIPNGVDFSNYHNIRKSPQKNSLIFTGSFRFSPNYEAMVWFLNEAYPHIQSRVPDVHLTITGDHANLPLPSNKSITLTGYVDDIRPYVARSWASIVPLHVGGGTRLKILEAMALGTPVVSTSKGAEGLDAQPDKHILIADSPEVFAESVIRLLEDPALRQKLSTNARQLIREKYDWKVIMPSFLDLIENLPHSNKNL